MIQARMTSGINSGAGWTRPAMLAAPLALPAIYSSASLRRWTLVLHSLKRHVPLKTGVVVPVDGFRDLVVEAVGLLDDLDLHVDHPSVLAVRPHASQPASLPGSPPAFTLELHGLRRGRTWIRVTHKEAGFEMGRLAVDVTKGRTYATRIWRVRDGGGRTGTRSAAQMKQVLAEANRYMVQANVDFYDQHAYVARNLEIGSLRFGAGGIRSNQIEHDILPALAAHADREVVADILLVPKLGTAGADGVGDSMLTFSRPPDSAVILVQDHISGGEERAGGCLAHELVHVFTLPHRKALGFDAEGHSNDEHDLMSTSVLPGSVLIDLPEARLINP